MAELRFTSRDMPRPIPMQIMSFTQVNARAGEILKQEMGAKRESCSFSGLLEKTLLLDKTKRQAETFLCRWIQTCIFLLRIIARCPRNSTPGQNEAVILDVQPQRLA